MHSHIHILIRTHAHTRARALITHTAAITSTTLNEAWRAALRATFGFIHQVLQVGRKRGVRVIQALQVEGRTHQALSVGNKGRQAG